MILREKIIALLAATSNVTSVIGGQPSMRAFAMRAPQGTRIPYLLITMPAHNIGSHLRGVTKLENPTIRFDMYGTNILELEALRDALIEMMNAATQLQAVYSFGTELYEDDTRYYHFVADFSVWNDRS